MTNDEQENLSTTQRRYLRQRRVRRRGVIYLITIVKNVSPKGKNTNSRG
jgi:hypothetical protein